MLFQLSQTFKYIFLAALSAVIPFTLKAQGIFSPGTGGRSAGLGGAGTCLTDVYSLSENQAGIVNIQSFSAFAFAERRYNLEEIQRIGAGAVLPVNSGAFGLQVGYYGFSLYNEQKAGLAYARNFFDKMSIGAEVDFYSFQIEDYGKRNTITFQLGLQTKLAKNLLLGVHVINPATLEKTGEEKLPSVFRIGMAYSPTTSVNCFLDWAKEQGYSQQIKVGVEYLPVEKLMIRAGVSTDPVQISLGTGYRVGRAVTIDFAASYHQQLGLTPTASLVFQRSQSQERS